MTRTISLGLLLLAACSSPPPLAHDAVAEPGLHEILGAFTRTVTRAREDPEVDWRSGWWGNVGVNLAGESVRGLCYEWQELVYEGVRDTVSDVGWSATGIHINLGTYAEHHAVIVWDPERSRREDLLREPLANPAYVLDAWRRGEPDVYPLAVWLTLPSRMRAPPDLEDPESWAAPPE